MRLTDMRFVPRRRRRIRSARRRGVEDSPLTAGVRCAMAMLMENDGTSILREVIEHCNDRWVEADGAEPVPGAFPTAEMLTGEKMAYNNVIQFARRRLAEIEEGQRVAAKP